MKIIKTVSSLLLFLPYSLFSSKLPHKQPTTIYCHELGGKGSRVKDLVARTVIQEPAIGVDFDKKKYYLGQAGDIDKVQEKIDQTENCILYGQSCGGSTATSCIAKHNSPKVRALVIEAAPSNMVNMVDDIQYRYGGFIFWGQISKEWILRKFHPGYPAGSTPPVRAIADIQNREMPVFIVHSHNDTTVNIRSSLENYRAFKKAGFPNVYLCQLQHGEHVHNSKGKDSHVFKQALHTFYKEHGFAHDTSQATLPNLTHLQPSEDEVDRQLAANQWKLRKQAMINLSILAGLGFGAKLCITATTKIK